MNFSIFKLSKRLFVATIFVAAALLTISASSVFADAPPGSTPSGTPSTTKTTTTTPSEPSAQELINPIGGTATSPGGVTSVPVLIANIIKTILGVIGAVALFMFIWGGFTWLTSGGNPDKVKQGKDTLVWATIGLLVIFASYTLVDVVFRALGAIQ